MKRTFLRGLTVLLLLLPGLVRADAPFPNRPVTLVVPYAAGNASDTMARALADNLAVRWGKPVVVENRPGAGGHIGVEHALRQPADGHTLVFTTISHNGSYRMFKNLRYDPGKDLMALGLVAEVPNVLLVRDGLEARNIEELVALARREPGRLSYGSAGIGTGTHMLTELFKHLAKLDILAVPYQGGAPALSALLGGQVDLIIESAVTAQQAVATGRVRALAVTSAESDPRFPDLPPISRAVPGYEGMLWYAVSASSRLPAALADQINGDLNAAIRSPRMTERWNAMGMRPLAGSREAARQRNEAELRRWTAVIEAANLRID